MECNTLFSTLSISGICPLKNKPGLIDFEISSNPSVLLSADWQRLASNAPVYLNPTYLKVELETMKSQLNHHYVLFYSEGKAIGIAVFHLMEVETESAVNRLGEKVAVVRKAAKHLSKGGQNYRFPMLINGSPFSTGELGRYFVPEISAEQAMTALRQAIRSIWKAEQDHISAILVKDFYSSSRKAAASLTKDGFAEFQVEPTMVMPISEDWKTLDDYLSSLKSKYRTKANAAFKRSESIAIKRLNAEEIEEHRPEIERLYNQVLSKADFGIGHFQFETFLQLADQFSEKYRFFGHFINGELVAFQTLWLFEDSLEAHFVGIDYTRNFEFAIYQRMLYEYIRLAIEEGKSKVLFGRTAMEIKSTVGALPMEAFCYIRHKKAAPNKLLQLLFNYVRPSEYKQHSPFRKKLSTELESKIDLDHENI